MQRGERIFEIDLTPTVIVMFLNLSAVIPFLVGERGISVQINLQAMLYGVPRLRSSMKIEHTG